MIREINIHRSLTKEVEARIRAMQDLIEKWLIKEQNTHMNAVISARDKWRKDHKEEAALQDRVEEEEWKQEHEGYSDDEDDQDDDGEP